MDAGRRIYKWYNDNIWSSKPVLLSLKHSGIYIFLRITARESNWYQSVIEWCLILVAFLQLVSTDYPMVIIRPSCVMVTPCRMILGWSSVNLHTQVTRCSSDLRLECFGCIVSKILLMTSRRCKSRNRFFAGYKEDFVRRVEYQSLMPNDDGCIGRLYLRDRSMTGLLFADLKNNVGSTIRMLI